MRQICNCLSNKSSLSGGQRAIAQIAKLSRELEKAEAHGGHICLPSGGKPKAEQLAVAGIATTTAHRYEQLAAPTEAMDDTWPGPGSRVVAMNEGAWRRFVALRSEGANTIRPAA